MHHTTSLEAAEVAKCEEEKCLFRSLEISEEETGEQLPPQPPRPFFHQRGNNTPPKDFNVPKNCDVLCLTKVGSLTKIGNGGVYDFSTKAPDRSAQGQLRWLGVCVFDGRGGCVVPGFLCLIQFAFGVAGEVVLLSSCR